MIIIMGSIIVIGTSSQPQGRLEENTIGLHLIHVSHETAWDATLAESMQITVTAAMRCDAMYRLHHCHQGENCRLCEPNTSGWTPAFRVFGSAFAIFKPTPLAFGGFRELSPSIAVIAPAQTRLIMTPLNVTIFALRAMKSTGQLTGRRGMPFRSN